MKSLLYISTILLLTVSSCTKNQIEKNLAGDWTISNYSLVGVNQVNGNNQYTLTIHNLADSEGEITLKHDDLGSTSTYYYVGEFTLNEDHTHMNATMSSGGLTLIWDVDVEVDKTLLKLTGEQTDNITSTPVGLSVNGAH